MAPRVFLFFFVVFFLLQTLSTITHAKRDIPTDEVPSPFDFINQLKGSHKGNKTKGIGQIKTYLRKFGYLGGNNETLDDDNFDDKLESAIKLYQQNYHITPTGTLDVETVSQMISPRCGMPDIVNGTNTMQTHGPSSSSGPMHVVSHYSFFSGTPKWPSTKRNLTYSFLANTPTNAIDAVGRAFQKWASVSPFRFTRQASNTDLVIGFLRLDHGDGSPFDGPGGVLAHAFAPTFGRFHYDRDERWSVGPVAGSFDLETVAIHEIGHLLGLGHSSVLAAIMYPSVSSGTVKTTLNNDDIQGLKALYNY